ncbi:transposase [Actinacidiphila oryziradicis]|uniref:transposase n=1 Tax=Actinacidiphila oryziradicis TaxID=2571141 RepID=UPI001B80459E|nr:transposase [Actinacidiphila oryziradicis]
MITGITNAASEGNNRLIKLEARNAFGFRTASTNAYGHAAQPPGGAAERRSPVKFEDP